MNLRIILSGVLVAAGLGAGFLGTDAALGLFGSEAEIRPESGESDAEPAPVTVAKPEVRTVADTFEAVGTVVPAQSVEIRPLTEGRVREVLFEAGGRVEAGEVLFTLDDRAERAALQQARATLVESESELRRNEALIDSNTTSEATLEAARANFLRAEAGVEQAQNALDDRVVKAPFAGVIGLADLDPGAQVTPAAVVATLDDLSSVEVGFSIPEQYFDAVEPGQTVRFSGAAYDDRSFEGSVDAIAPRIDPASRTFEIRAVVPNPDGALAGGMFVIATLVLDERRSLTVPESAVISEGDGDFVFALDGETAVRRDIAVGLQLDGAVEVLDGIEPETLVITRGYDGLEDGDPVRRTELAAASPQG